MGSVSYLDVLKMKGYMPGYSIAAIPSGFKTTPVHHTALPIKERLTRREIITL
jgi:hypothetical protein